MAAMERGSMLVLLGTPLPSPWTATVDLPKLMDLWAGGSPSTGVSVALVAAHSPATTETLRHFDAARECI